MSFIKALLKSKNPYQTVFTVADLTNTVSGYSGKKLKSALKYAAHKNDLIRISRGIYSLSTNYSLEELGNKYRRPSYISLYTILQENGIVFQPYTSIFLAANRSETVELNRQKYIYRKIKNEILLNPLGIDTVGHISKATAERAIGDKLYLDGPEHFDNLNRLNWNLMEELNARVYQHHPVITAFLAENKP